MRGLADIVLMLFQLDTQFRLNLPYAERARIVTVFEPNLASFPWLLLQIQHQVARDCKRFHIDCYCRARSNLRLPRVLHLVLVMLWLMIVPYLDCICQSVGYWSFQRTSVGHQLWQLLLDYVAVFVMFCRLPNHQSGRSWFSVFWHLQVTFRLDMRCHKSGHLLKETGVEDRKSVV